MSVRPFPNDFTSKLIRPKHRVQHQLQIMARGRVAVQVQATRRLQHPVQFHQSHRHHAQISHHGIFADGRFHRLHQHMQLVVAALRNVHQRVVRTRPPLPGVVKGFDAGVGASARCALEQHIIGGVGIEGRVQIDKIDRLVLHMRAQHIQIVAIVKPVLHAAHPNANRGRGKCGVSRRVRRWCRRFTQGRMSSAWDKTGRGQ